MPKSPTINTTSAPKAPTLGLVLDDVLNTMVVNAKHSAVLLAQHHRAFNGEAECQAVITRIGSILHDAAIQIENVGASMSEATKEKLHASRSLEIKHRAIG